MFNLRFCFNKTGSESGSVLTSRPPLLAVMASSFGQPKRRRRERDGERALRAETCYTTFPSECTVQVAPRHRGSTILASLLSNLEMGQKQEAGM